MNNHRSSVIGFVLFASLISLIWSLSYDVYFESSSPISKTDTTIILYITSVVYFDFNSSEISDTNLRTLAQIALKSSGEILIYGLTDDLGEERYNLKLSEQRALAVKDKLINLGYDPEKIKIQPQGEKWQVSFSDKSLNRRTVIKWTQIQ